MNAINSNEQMIQKINEVMQDVIKHGNNNTKVLMLSATPVNNSFG